MKSLFDTFLCVCLSMLSMLCLNLEQWKLIDRYLDTLDDAIPFVVLSYFPKK